MFMKRRFPDLYIGDLNKITEHLKGYQDINKRFTQYFSYVESENPCEVIKGIYVK